MIELKNIIKRYQTSRKKRKLVLNNISIKFLESGFVFVVGDQDSGKSTILNLIASLDQPNYGQIFHDNKIVSFNNLNDIYHYRNHVISMIFSDSQITFFRTVKQEISRILRLREFDKDEAKIKTDEILSKLNISHLGNKYRYMIKKEDMKLIGLAIAFAKDTKIILVDNIDTSIISALKELSKEKLIIATTDDENLAYEHADQMIKLENGQIVKNIENDPKMYIKSEDVTLENNIKNKRKKNNYFNFAKLISSLIVLMLSLFTLSTYTTLFIELNSISEFDIAINQLSDEEIYLAPVAKYQERAFTYGWSFIVQAGTFDYSQDVRESYRDLLVDKIDNQLSLYQSYFFNKNLQDFFEISLDIPKIYQSNNFKSLHFTEVIIVDDFSDFRQPIIYGSIPSANNDVLIYDYMAEQIIEAVNLNMTDISNLVGTTLVDHETSLSLNISGIMKSNYKDFYYIQNSSFEDISVELKLLQELQSIVAKPELLEKILLENDIYSIDKILLLDHNGLIYNEDLDYRKMRITRTIDVVDMIGITRPIKEGIILSKHQLSRMLNIDVDIINDQYINSLLPYLNYQIELRHFNFDYKMNKSKHEIITVPIYGIFDSLEDDEYVINYYKESGSWYPLNGSIRRFYLSLSDDFELNKTILEQFKVPESKSFIFFYENLSYQTDDFGFYHSSRLIGEQMIDYIIMISEGFINIILISTVLLILSILMFNQFLTSYDDKAIKLKRMLYYKNSRILLNYATKFSMLLMFIMILSLTTLRFFIDYYHEYLNNIKSYFSLNSNLIHEIRVQHLIYIFIISMILFLSTRYMKLIKYPYISIKK
jgi:ABC-type lipoprotein export system ATPase subunit